MTIKRGDAVMSLGDITIFSFIHHRQVGQHSVEYLQTSPARDATTNVGSWSIRARVLAASDRR